MKKFNIILLWIVLITPISVMAQFNRNTFMIGGGISGSFNTNWQNNGSASTKNYTDNSIIFSPQFGYFVRNNFAIGGMLQIEDEVSKYNGSSDKFEYVNLGTGPFARYYYKSFFAQGQCIFGLITEQDIGVNGPVSKAYNSSWQFGVGYAWLLNEHVAIEPQLGYGSTYIKSDNSNFTERTSTPGFIFKIVFQVYLNR